MISCWNNGLNYKRLCDHQLYQGNRCLQRGATCAASDIIFVISSFVYFLVSTNKSAYLGHTTGIIVVYQSLGLIWDLTALERNVFGLEEIADQQAVSTFCLFPQISLFPHLNSFLWRYRVLPLQHRLLAQIFLAHFLYTLSHQCIFVFYILHLPQNLRTQSLYGPFHPHYSRPQPKPRQAGRQAARLGAQMVLWRVSQLWVSEPAGRQDGPSVADMAEASPGTCLWLWTSRGTSGLAHRENTASTQQTEGLTVKGLTNPTCDLTAVLFSDH